MDGLLGRTTTPNLKLPLIIRWHSTPNGRSTVSIRQRLAEFVAEVVVGSEQTNFSRLTDDINEAIGAIEQTFTGL